ncbi:MAG TPA: response regulator transcription factor, partial [Thermoleophilaceae bacterium]|nr:response regulator transcription factor [Thermoleophilaceae bacterium]
ANADAQALVLSAHVDRGAMARAVQQGAAAVLSKATHLHDVVASVRRLRAGEALIPLDEVVELLRLAGRERERELDERRLIDSLTPREREVLQLVALGLDSEGVAARLHISPRTQRNHMANILGKLGVHSQLQALIFALRYKVVDVPRAAPATP